MTDTIWSALFGGFNVDLRGVEGHDCQIHPQPACQSGLLECQSCGRTFDTTDMGGGRR